MVFVTGVVCEVGGEIAGRSRSRSRGRSRSRSRSRSRGQEVGEVGGGAAVGVEGRDLAAVFEADDRLGAGRGGRFVRGGRGAPQPGVGVQERVVAGQPGVGLGGQEAGVGPGDQGGGGQLGAAQLVAEVAPEDRGGLGGDGRVGEEQRRARVQQGPQLVRAQQADQAGVRGQGQVPGRVRRTVGGRDQGLGLQRGPHHVEQRPEHRAGREPGRVQGQGGQRGHREQSRVPQPGEHLGQQGRGLGHEVLVGRVVLGDVVPGRGGPVRALSHEAQERLLLGREEHAQRRPVQRADPRGVPGIGPERDLHGQGRGPRSTVSLAGSVTTPAT